MLPTFSYIADFQHIRSGGGYFCLILFKYCLTFFIFFHFFFNFIDKIFCFIEKSTNFVIANST